MKDKYEISLWEDYLVPASTDVPEHYEERKLGIIGSDSITAPCRAYDPKLVENINGTHQFSFKMFYTFREDNNIEDIIHQFITSDYEDLKENNSYNLAWKEIRANNDVYQNPFLSLLVNERKVKVFWKNQWYDFVIKNCREDSSQKSITYICEDAYINELSKNGFDIVLDASLNNNCDTAINLAELIINGTDWKIDKNNSDIIQQTSEEPVYEVDLSHALIARNQNTGQNETINKNSKILIFYNQIQEILPSLSVNTRKTCDLQFAYSNIYSQESGSQKVVDANCFVATVRLGLDSDTEVIKIYEFGTTRLYGEIAYKNNISTQYRADRLVKMPQTKFDSLTGKYCDVWKATRDGEGAYQGLISKDDLIYGYVTNVWREAQSVNNLVINSQNFSDTSGWRGDNLYSMLYPPIDDHTDLNNVLSYLKLTYQGDDLSASYYNACFQQAGNYLSEGIKNGEYYIFRFKALVDEGGHPSHEYFTGENSPIVPYIHTYDDEMKWDSNGISYADVFSGPSFDEEENWIEYKLKCVKSATANDFNNKKIGLFLFANSTCWLQEAQFFKEVITTNDNRVNPGEINTDNVYSTFYTYYNYTKTRSYMNADDIAPLYQGASAEDWDFKYIERVENNNFEKIRSITAKQSNRFNLLQSIAETFQCWIRFNINHDTTGKLIYNNGEPEKFISIKKEIGQNTGLGFKYGLDLKTITREIQSDKIVTKTIVSHNDNQSAKDGFCAIERSSENYPKTNFILNFDYYISHGLLDPVSINNDLYNRNGLGYFFWLNKYNTYYDEYSENLIIKQASLDDLQYRYELYTDMITSTTDSINSIKQELMDMVNKYGWDSAWPHIVFNYSRTEINSRVKTMILLTKSLSQYEEIKNNLEAAIQTTKNYIDDYQGYLEYYSDEIKDLHLRFYKKYARFIHEGNWIDKQYIDDNFYYLDAQAVAFTSSRPQVSYNISAIRLSNLEEFKNRIFKIGDIAFIQDDEFFGYKQLLVNGVKTPYREKVLISEIISYFDEPDKDSFKIQNYRTQFEDLFQRITSATQSLKFESGAYARAASVINTNGTISNNVLQNSLDQNLNLSYSTTNNTIMADPTGLTVTDPNFANKKTKITSGGILVSNDGGLSWISLLSSEGISTRHLTVGSIDTNSIAIMDGSHVSFRWDSSGINSYATSNGSGIIQNKFVRFDHYGIYGMDNVDSHNPYIPSSEDDIWNEAKFGLTWKGFFVKNKSDTGMVEISSTNDIRIIQGNKERIKIGRLSGSGTSLNPYVYGLRISDNNGEGVMETSNDGTLWLKKELHISATASTNYISIGYLPNTKPNSSTHEVFNATNKFIIYEDGSIKASEGEFTGKIYASEGNIGDSIILDGNSSKIIIGNSNKQITLDGGNSKISGSTFSITPDLAEFSNITVSGKISTMVFEKNHVQSVGGSMIFNTSYQVVEITNDGYSVILDNEYPYIYGGAYVGFVDKNGALSSTIYEVATVSADKKTISFNSPVDNDKVSLILFGEDNQSMIIGINSNDSGIQFLKPRGLTISTFSTANPTVNVFLGDLGKSRLTDFNGNNLSGYGLYADNVYLRGSLVGSKIYSAEISGIGNQYGLTFNDVENGIYFKTSDTSRVSEEIFTIGKYGISANGYNFLHVDGGTNEFYFNTGIENGRPCLQLSYNTITHILQAQEGSPGKSYSRLRFENNSENSIIPILWWETYSDLQQSIPTKIFKLSDHELRFNPYGIGTTSDILEVSSSNLLWRDESNALFQVGDHELKWNTKSGFSTFNIYADNTTSSLYLRLDSGTYFVINASTGIITYYFNGTSRSFNFKSLPAE